MRLRDPRAPRDKDGRPDGAVDVNGDLVPVESDGTFAHPAIDEAWAEAYAERNDATLAEVVIERDEGDANAPPDADPEAMIDRGECPWCSDYAGDHVGQHASSAHPEKWAAYKEED